MMTEGTLAPAPVPADKGLLGRFVGIIVSPQETYRDIVARPRWLGMLALSCLVMVALVGGFMFSQVGQDAWLDMMASRPGVTDQQMAGMERIAPYIGYFAIGQILIFVPILYLIVAGILYAVFNAGFGGEATFKQVYSVVVHSAPVGILGQLFTVPINYARGAMTSATTLGVLLPVIDDESFLGRFLGMIDLFLAWQLVVLAIGLAVLYRRRTQPIATSLFVVYGVIALAAAAIMSWLAGS
jgi:hypothetical protein